MQKKNNSQTWWILFFVAPGLVIVSIFIIYPLIASMLNSFFSWDNFVRGEFVGFKNFQTLFTQFPYNERFFNAIGNNVKWFLSSMLIQNTLGVLFGYLLSRNIKGQGLYKRVFFMPVLLPVIAIGFLWKLYYNPQFGLFLKIFELLGIEEHFQPWLGNPSTAIYAIILVNLWRWTGFPTLVFLAAIDNVPEECIESAHLEGASEWKTFWKVIFPLVIPAVMIITVLTLIGSINVFEQIYSMAGIDAQPNYSTDTLGTLFYRLAFGGFSAGIPEVHISSALSIVIYILCLGLSLISINFLQKREVSL